MYYLDLVALLGIAVAYAFVKALCASHPEIYERIAKLQEMGVPYSRY